MTDDDPDFAEAFNRCTAYFQAQGTTPPPPDWTYIPDWLQLKVTWLERFGEEY